MDDNSINARDKFSDARPFFIPTVILTWFRENEVQFNILEYEVILLKHVLLTLFIARFQLNITEFFIISVVIEFRKYRDSDDRSWNSYWC